MQTHARGHLARKKHVHLTNEGGGCNAIGSTLGKGRTGGGGEEEE